MTTCRERVYVLCLLLAALAGLSHRARTPLAEEGWHTVKGRAQGTTYLIRYRSTAPVFDNSALKAFFDSIDASLSLYKAGSAIDRFNRASKGMPIDAHLRAVVAKGMEVQAVSGGAFDIAVRPLMELWGFGSGKVTRPPSAARVDRTRAYTGTGAVSLSGDSLLKRSRQVRLDLDGIAQGYTVDLLAERLEGASVKDFLVELGGEVRVGGRAAHGKPWTIGLEAPSREPSPSDEAMGERVLYLHHGAVTTSGSYRRFREFGGRRFPHIMDPATGRPVENGMVSATVWAKDAMTADAWDNVCMVLGTRSLRLLEGVPGVEAFLVYVGADGTVGDTCTSGFNALFKGN